MVLRLATVEGNHCWLYTLRSVLQTVVSDDLLSVDNLQVSLDSRKGPRVAILDGLTFVVGRGEFVSVMGPSGCGKSTLLNVLAGFQKPTAGTVVYRGAEIGGPSAERGVVFQSPALFPWLTSLGNAMFGPLARGVEKKQARAEALALLHEVGLSHATERHPYELSGGMKHRLALARTLANRPELLLMDEPFAALDAETRFGMQVLLLGLSERHKMTVIFVTHDIEEGLLLADRVLVLGGRPARVRKCIKVHAARPRDPDIVLTTEFVALRKQLRALMVELSDSGQGSI